ncbi:MAG TPA: type II toxin-antitoxin system prevent-host-death family antitoxin [Polyangiaceae bacterium]|jgi:prevent-host-death family protein|nr:type II toxin-antitoxin system prevent-host-death family antitoxin [Polyangiaceae bacterium]
MKTAALRDVKARLSEYCERAQYERVLVTKHGKPLALMVGVQGRDLEELLTTANPEFWLLVDERRRQPELSQAELLIRLGRKSRKPSPGKEGRARKRSGSSKRGR